MQNSTLQQHENRPFILNRISLPGLALLVVIAGLLCYRLWWAPSPPPDAPLPISPAIEARWGVRITQISVTADGGLVDMRYLVLDPDKAMKMMDTLATTPTITDDETGQVMRLNKVMPHKHSMDTGRIYYILYVNTRGALYPGGSATVHIGDLNVGPIRVK